VVRGVGMWLGLWHSKARHLPGRNAEVDSRVLLSSMSWEALYLLVILLRPFVTLIHFHHTLPQHLSTPGSHSILCNLTYRPRTTKLGSSCAPDNRGVEHHDGFYPAAMGSAASIR
jgi:hypothetical protein